MVSPRQLALGYAAIYGAVGAFGPWLGLVLTRQGHDAGDVALWLALMPATAVFGGPMWAWAADRFHIGTRILQGTTAGAAVLATAIALPLPSALLAPILVGLGLMRSGMALVLDAFTLRGLERAGADPTRYGRIRRWGSVGFVGGTAIAAGLAQTPWTVAPIVLAAVLWALASAGFSTLPRAAAQAPTQVFGALVVLARQPGLAWLLVALPLYCVGMNAYDTWYAVHLESLGLGTQWTAAAIAVGVTTEVALMGRATQLFARVAPRWVVVAAMGLAVVRWLLVAVLTDPYWLTALQLTHGLVFGGFWVGTVEWLRRLAPIEIRASAQMALPVLGYGIGPVLTGLIAKAVVPVYGTEALFVAAAGAAAVATVLAAIGAARSPAS